jgi:hypothetical protein
VIKVVSWRVAAEGDLIFFVSFFSPFLNPNILVTCLEFRLLITDISGLGEVVISVVSPTMEEDLTEVRPSDMTVLLICTKATFGI